MHVDHHPDAAAPPHTHIARDFIQGNRYAWAYLFGAVCPERAVGAGLVMPHADTEAVNPHLVEIGNAVAPAP